MTYNQMRDETIRKALFNAEWILDLPSKDQIESYIANSKAKEEVFYLNQDIFNACYKMQTSIRVCDMRKFGLI